MQTKSVTVILAKESSEVFDAMEGLILDIKAGKKTPELLAGNIGRLMTAIEGFDQIGEEVKSVEFYETAALGGAKLTRALVGKKDV